MHSLVVPAVGRRIRWSVGLALLAVSASSCGEDLDRGAGDESDTGTSSLDPSSTGAVGTVGTETGTDTGVGSDSAGTGAGTESGDPPTTCPGVEGSTLPLTPGTHFDIQLEFEAETQGHAGPRSFGLYVPTGYDTSQCNPALLFLHGTDPGPTPTHVQQTYMGGSHWDTIAEQHKFLVAYPVGTIYPEANAYGFYTRTFQEMADHHRWIDTVREVLIQEGAVDPNRVFVMGFSTGGFAAGESVVASGDKYAAYGVLAAGAHPNLQYNVPPEGRGMYIFIGTGDEGHLPLSQTLAQELRSGGWTDGVDLIYNERPGWGHQYDSSLNAEQWAFFNQFSLAWNGPRDPTTLSHVPASPARLDVREPLQTADGRRTAVVAYDVEDASAQRPSP